MATYGKHDRQVAPKKRKILLVACGSFNPITNMHLRMFEVARDALEQNHPCYIIGIISPVNDKYSRKEIAPCYDRIEMVKLALTSSDWIKVDTWEASQDTWLETVKILRHMREIASSYFPPSDDNDNDDAHSTKRRRTRDVNKNIEKCEDSPTLSPSPLDIEVRLLCGADVIQSFAVPDLWNPAHIEEIVRDFGMVVCNRVGYDLDKFIYEFDALSAYKINILVVTDWITNEISSTKIRRALKRGESVKYLLQDLVIDYIHHKQLYNAKITNEILEITRKLSLAAEGNVIFKKKEMFFKKPAREVLKSENVCSYCHLYTCCCCWFLDDNPSLDVGSSLFQHHHHYHLPPHPHPSLHSSIHHCHPMGTHADPSRWTQDLAETLPTDDGAYKTEGLETFFSKSIDIPGISLPVRSETNV